MKIPSINNKIIKPLIISSAILGGIAVKSCSSNTNEPKTIYTHTNVDVGNRTETIKVEAGLSLNIDGRNYYYDEKGYFYNENSDKEKIYGELSMDEAQFKSMETIAMNVDEGEEELTLSKRDIEEAAKKLSENEEYLITMNNRLTNSACVKQIYTSEKEQKMSIELGYTYNQGITKVLSFNYKDAVSSQNAKNMYKIINNETDASKILEQFDTINNNELVGMIRYYNNHYIVCGEKTVSDEYYDEDKEYKEPIYNAKGIFQDMNNIEGIGIKELTPRIKRAFRLIPNNFGQTSKIAKEKYQKLAKIVNSLDEKKSGCFSDDEIKTIDDMFAICR